MRDKGCAVIIITHKLGEVLEISDRVTILRKGESVATVNTAETNAHELTELMVGHAVELAIDCPPYQDDGVVLNVHHLTISNSDGAQAVKDVSFDLKKGKSSASRALRAAGRRSCAKQSPACRK